MRTGRLRQFVYCFLFILCGHPVLSQAVSCPPNIDFEFGNFQNWQCYLGSTASSGGVNTINVAPSAPTSGRHTIITSAQAGQQDPYGSFPVLCPNGSGYSIKLGNSNTNREAERVSYTFTIPAGQNEYSIVYQYAVVFQDPGHASYEQPRFTARVYDQTTGNYISCATFQFIATSNLPGFLHSTVSSSVWYKPWTPVTINLSGYGGRTVILEFTTADCTQGAHFGYAYVDVNIGCTSPVGGATFCPGASAVTLNAPYGYQSYAWYDSLMTIQLGNQPTLIITPPPAINTTYALDIIPFPGFGCRDTVYATIKPGIAPPADAGPDINLCTGSAQSIGTTALTGYSYSWSPATGLNNPSIANPIASPTSTTNYVLTVTDLITGCTKKDTVNVGINIASTSSFSVNAAGQCFTGNNFQFNNPNPASLNYQWKFGDGASSTDHDPLHHYNNPGNYTVSLVATSGGGCIDSTSHPVAVYTMPNGSLSSGTTIICEGTPVTLTSTGGTTYNWYLNGTLVSANSGNSYNASNPGTYSAQIIDQNGCMSPGDNTIALTLTRKPSVDFSYDKYCVDFPVSFTNSSTVNNSLPVDYNWDFGNGTTSSLLTPSVQFATAGLYQVSLSVTPQNCPQLVTVLQKNITIKNPVPGINYIPLNAVENKPLQLKARNIGSPYTWFPSTFLSNPTIDQPVFNGNSEEYYMITIVNPSGCITIDSQLVRIFKEKEIYVPKAFTPNGDGQNDRMFPFLVGIRELKVFRIMNRWGVVVYESKTDLPGWDGTYRGAPQPMEGYVWEAQAIDIDGNTLTRKGSFTLIR